MANAQYKNDVSPGIVAIQGDVTGAPARNQQLTQPLLDRATNERMALESLESVDDQRTGLFRGPLRLFQQEFGESVEIKEGLRRKVQRRHARCASD